MESSAESFDLQAVRGAIQDAIKSYTYPADLRMVGNDWKTDRVTQALQRLREALIDPYWANVERRDTFEQVGMEKGSMTRSVVVADDDMGTLLLFDPKASEYFLAVREGRELVSIGVSGDAVGCFLAR